MSNPENWYQIEGSFKNGIKAMSTPVLAALHPETIQDASVRDYGLMGKTCVAGSN